MNKALIASVAGVILAIVFVSGLNVFFDHYRLRSPIILQVPLEKRVTVTVTPKLSPTATPTPKVKIATPTPTLKPKKVSVLPFRKYLTADGALVREKVLRFIDRDYSDENDRISFDNVLKKEAGYLPTAINEIGACGMGQALPCEKMPCNLSLNDADIECQYNWIKRYISSRYQTPSLAWKFHLENNWY